MIQQVNLYQDILKTGQSQSVGKNIVLSFIAVLVLFIGFSMYLFMELNASEKNLNLINKQLKETDARIQQLQIQYPKKLINSLLIQEITQSQKILTSLKQVIGLLTDKTAVQNQGFSQFFSALARQTIPEVWLNTIIINAEKKQLLFQGTTNNPEKIPVLLQKWHKESAFQGKDFSQLSLLQAEEYENQIDFIVSSNADLLIGTDHE